MATTTEHIRILELERQVRNLRRMGVLVFVAMCGLVCLALAAPQARAGPSAPSIVEAQEIRIIDLETGDTKATLGVVDGWGELRLYAARPMVGPTKQGMEERGSVVLRGGRDGEGELSLFAGGQTYPAFRASASQIGGSVWVTGETAAMTLGCSSITAYSNWSDQKVAMQAVAGPDGGGFFGIKDQDDVWAVSLSGYRDRGGKIELRDRSGVAKVISAAD
jgi:hypothetical protein